MSLSIEKTHEWMGQMMAAGYQVKVVKNLELSRMSTGVWEDVYVNGVFYGNIVDGELALGTVTKPIKLAA